MCVHAWWAWTVRIGLGLFAVFNVAGCAVPPPPPEFIASSDPSVPVPLGRYRTVTAGTREFSPVRPRPWTKRKARPAYPESKGQSQ